MTPHYVLSWQHVQMWKGGWWVGTQQCLPHPNPMSLAFPSHNSNNLFAQWPYGSASPISTHITVTWGQKLMHWGPCRFSLCTTSSDYSCISFEESSFSIEIPWVPSGLSSELSDLGPMDHGGKKSESVSHSVVSKSFWLHGLLSTWPFCPWNSPSKNTRMACHSLLWGIFPTQGPNLDLPHCRQILHCLSHQGSPRGCGDCWICSQVR